MSDLHVALQIAVMAAVSIGLRAVPFLIFRDGRNLPPFLRYLGKVLPYAVMGMLVIYCLKDVSLAASPHGLPELIAGGLVVGLHAWKHNTLLSIIAGVACYMVLVQAVFV